MAHSSHTYGSTDQRTDVPDVGFSPTEMYSLSESITANIYAINASWKTLDKVYKTIGTKKDDQNLREKVHITQMSTNQVVTQTSRSIARLTELMRRGDKQQKLQIEKLTTDFKDVLRRYSDMQQSIADKMKRHILPSTINVLDNQQDSYYQEGDDDDNDDEQKGLIQQVHIDEQKRAEQRALEFDQGLILEREDRIRRIEGDILDVNQIMRELGALVHQQGDVIDTIENSIENVQEDIELGARELVKASSYQNKFRRKILFLILIAIIVVIILTVILVIQNKKQS